MALPLCAQFGPSGGSTSASVADQLPLSGRARGQLRQHRAKAQRGAPERGSVNTLNSTLQVQGNLQGSTVPAATPSPKKHSLTLVQAIERGAQVQPERGGFNNAQREANSRKTRGARAQLLPADERRRARVWCSRPISPRRDCGFPLFPLGPGQNFNFFSIVGPFNHGRSGQRLPIGGGPHLFRQLSLQQGERPRVGDHGHGEP